MDLTVPKEHLWQRLSGEGIEIGAFHSPMPVPKGTRVRYVDLISAEDTHRFYPEAAEQQDIVTPDILSPADHLPMIATGSQDFVIASHLLEHLADPIAGLCEWHRILKPQGLVLLVLPDMRNTFDRHREHTTLEHLERDHARSGTPERTQRDRRTYEEWSHWINGIEDPGQIAFWARMLESVSYPIHFHCWIPKDIPELLAALEARQDVSFEVADQVTRDGAAEFALLLEKG